MSCKGLIVLALVAVATAQSSCYSNSDCTVSGQYCNFDYTTDTGACQTCTANAGFAGCPCTFDTDCNNPNITCGGGECYDCGGMDYCPCSTDAQCQTGSGYHCSAYWNECYYCPAGAGTDYCDCTTDADCDGVSGYTCSGSWGSVSYCAIPASCGGYDGCTCGNDTDCAYDYKCTSYAECLYCPPGSSWSNCPCTSDADCDSYYGYTCDATSWSCVQTGSGSGVGSYCSVTTDCSTGLDCVYGSCESCPYWGDGCPCTADSDCSSGYYCDSSNECWYSGSSSCTAYYGTTGCTCSSDIDCYSPYYTCDYTSYTCQYDYSSGCTTNAGTSGCSCSSTNACDASLNYACDDYGYCSYCDYSGVGAASGCPCEYDTDCEISNGYTCSSGYCYYTGMPSCSSGTPCPSSDYYCDTTWDECYYCPTGEGYSNCPCTDNTDCASDYACSYGSCEYNSCTSGYGTTGCSCSSDSDCWTGADYFCTGGYCEYSYSSCSSGYGTTGCSCSSDSDCWTAADYVCSFGYCEYSYTCTGAWCSCTTDSDCSSGYFCNYDYCDATCTVDSDCSYGYTCSGVSTNGNKYCEYNSMCGGLYCTCYSDADCDSSYVCSQYDYCTDSCTSDAECSYGYTCSGVTSSGQYYCEYNYVTYTCNGFDDPAGCPCTDASTCSQLTGTVICAGASTGFGFCFDSSYCTTNSDGKMDIPGCPCSANSDCSSPMSCVSGSCDIPTCFSDGDCKFLDVSATDNFECLLNYCIDPVANGFIACTEGTDGDSFCAAGDNTEFQGAGATCTFLGYCFQTGGQRACLNDNHCNIDGTTGEQCWSADGANHKPGVCVNPNDPPVIVCEGVNSVACPGTSTCGSSGTCVLTNQCAVSAGDFYTATGCACSANTLPCESGSFCNANGICQVQIEICVYEGTGGCDCDNVNNPCEAGYTCSGGKCIAQSCGTKCSSTCAANNGFSGCPCSDTNKCNYNFDCQDSVCVVPQYTYCDDYNTCPSDQVCSGNACVDAPSGGSGSNAVPCTPATASTDCSAGQICVNRFCQKPSSTGKFVIDVDVYLGTNTDKCPADNTPTDSHLNNRQCKEIGSLLGQKLYGKVSCTGQTSSDSYTLYISHSADCSNTYLTVRGKSGSCDDHATGIAVAVYCDGNSPFAASSANGLSVVVGLIVTMIAALLF
jgi:hypothetical protein